jgi:hypothetical protein
MVGRRCRTALKNLLVVKWRYQSFSKVGFSSFLLRNREKIAFVANANLSHFCVKIPG